MMRIRAVLLGFLGAIAICGLTYLNDKVLGQTYLVGNNLPVSVFGALILFLLFNVVLFMLSPKLALTGRDLAIVLAMTLAACVAPGSGLMRTFPSSILMPHHYNHVTPRWQANRIVDEVAPETALVDIHLVEAEGKIKVADVQTVTLDEAATATTPTAYEGMLLKVYAGPRRQARTVTGYDPATRTARVDAEWETIPTAGQTYTLLKNNEEEVLTAYMQGKADTQSRAFRATVRGRSQAVDGTMVTLAVDASPIDNAYAGMKLTLLSGDFKGKSRRIMSYDGTSRQAILDEPFLKGKLTPDPKSDYQITETGAPSRLNFWAQDKISGLARSSGPDTIVLSDTAAAGSDAYCDQQITIVAGAGQGQTRTIVDYNGSAKVAVVGQPWETPPAAGSLYEIQIDNAKLARLSREVRGQALGGTEKGLTLGDEATHRDNVYNGMTIEITSGPLQGETRKIAVYKGKERELTVNEPWTEVPAAGVSYRIVPRPTVPWHAWKGTLRLWLPLILAFWISMIGLSLVLHRQWSTHEHLPYPVASFTNSLLPEDDGRISSVFRTRMFWIAGGIVLAIYLNNYMVTWFPDAWIQIPRQVIFEPVFDNVRLLEPIRSAWWMKRATIFFTVVAFAYFLSTDVSLSCGLAPTVYAAVVYYVGRAGVSIGGGAYFGVNHEKFLIFGAYLGLTLILMYTGRTYYLSVARRMLFLPARDNPPPSSVWGARVALLGYLVFVVTAALPTRLGGIGLDWQLAALYGAGAIMLFTIMSRIIAETGLFFIQSYWLPCSIIVGLLGTRALGPQTMLTLFLLSMVLMVDPREALMPFMINNLKIVELRQHKLGRATSWCTAALVVGLAVAMFVTIYLQYSKGAPLRDVWATKGVPSMPFDEAITQKQVLAARGQLEESMAVSGFGRFIPGVAKPANGWFLLSLSIGLLLVIGFSIGRLRFPNWPLHPVMFLIWAAYPAMCFAFSFLLGWALKVVVTKFGGSRVYQSLKPMMFGLIAGELLGAMVPIIIGFIYYIVTGENPKNWNIFPG